MEILSEPGHLDSLTTNVCGKYTAWASMAADESEMELEESDIEALLGNGDLETRTWDTTHETNKYDVAKRMVYISAFKRAVQVMVEQALTLDNLDSELSRLKRETRHDHDQREKRLRLAESQARLFRKEAESNSANVEHLRSQVSSLLAEKQGWSLSDSHVIPLDEHEEIMQRLQEESRRRVDSVEAEKGYIAFELSSVRLQLAQLQNQNAEIDYREDLLDVLAEKLKNALTREEEHSIEVNREYKLALANAEQNIETLSEKLHVTNTAREHAEDNATRFKTMFEELNIAYNDVRRQLTIVEEAHDRLAEAADEITINDLRSEVEQLKLSLAECERVRDAASTEKESLQVFSDEKQAELETKAKELEDLKMHIDQLSEELSKVTSERDSARSDLQSAESTCKSLDRQLEEASSRIGLIEKERDATLTESERLKALLEEADKHLAEGKEEHRLTTSELVEALRKVDQALNGNEVLRSDLAQEKVKYQRMEDHVHELEMGAVQNENELRAAKADADALRKKLDEMLVQQSKAVEVHRLESEEIHNKLLKSQKDYAQSVNEVEMANKMISNLKSDLERANSDQDELRKRAQELKDKLRKASEDLQHTSQTVEEAELRSHNLKDLCDKLQNELNSTQSTVESLESSLRDKQELLEKAGEEKAQVERDLLSVNADLTTNKKLLLDSTTIRNKLTKELDEVKASLLESNDTLRQTVSKASADRDTFNNELDQIKKGLMEAIKQQHEALRENEQLRLKLADAEANHADAQQSKMDAQKDRKEALQTLHLLQGHLADAQIRLASIEQQNKRLLTELKNERDALKRAQSVIGKQEAARQKMAAIYSNSPHQSPDRPVPSMSHFSTTPSSSPPASAMPLSNASSDVVERPHKRGKFARSTWPSIETSTTATSSPSSQPVPIPHQATASESSINDVKASSSSRDGNLGTSVDTAIPLDDDNDVEESQSITNLDVQDAPADVVSQEHDDSSTPQTSGTKRKRRKAVTSADSKGRVSAKTSQAPTLRLTRRRRAMANDEKPSDVVRESPVPEGSVAVVSDRPSLMESCPKDFQLGHSVWALWGRLARLASWKDPSTSQFICGFCKVEKDCGKTDSVPQLGFNPYWAASDFWRHCMSKHHCAFRCDAQERATAFPVLADQSQGQRIEIQQYTQLLAEFISWKRPGDEHFTCGLCQLENASKGEEIRGPLDFNSWSNPELFFGHCRTEHVVFWNSELSTSVHLVPDYILRMN